MNQGQPVLRGHECLVTCDQTRSALFPGLFLGDPRRPYPTDLEMRSGLLCQLNNPSANGVNGHLPGDALAAGRLPGVLAGRALAPGVDPARANVELPCPPLPPSAFSGLKTVLDGGYEIG